MASLKYNNYLLDSIVFLLVLLWAYTALSKLSNLNEFKLQIHYQNFSTPTAKMLLWFIPGIEISATGLLLFAKTRFSGLLLSSILMFAFTGYVGLVLVGFYDKVPCSCGGALSVLGWEAHLWFNLFFLSLSLLGTKLQITRNSN
ncbi:MauE/DoxX family redox-associated membrane protein [Pedobacter namyangjuensis]|uniref:MauE/DoxX family redox-associated membrane protein n=1 Tax=Pedobacter namyangjuensis TaxID=600626 RepID=UPI000DE4F4CD|nr:MauE/DoxX family redox-associated membrane protein [Pedobacter namyangjuensis]